MIRDLVLKTRSYRRFFQDRAIDLPTLRELVDLGRLSASGMNVQSLKYLLFCEPEDNALIFPHLHWAAHLKDWPGPVEGERPAAYIIILGDQKISSSSGCDQCIAAQSIMLGATEKGLGGCMIRGIERKPLRKALRIQPRYEILLILALGTPKEQVVVDPLGSDGDTRYWRDEQGIHHVPKRSLDEIIIG